MSLNSLRRPHVSPVQLNHGGRFINRGPSCKVESSALSDSVLLLCSFDPAAHGGKNCCGLTPGEDDFNERKESDHEKTKIRFARRSVLRSSGAGGGSF